MNPANVVQTLLSSLSNFKTGWKTSEFWVTLVPVVVGILGVFGVHLSNGSTATTLTVVWGAVSTIYVAARTYLKKVHLGHVTSLTAVLKQLETEGKVIVDAAASAPAPEAPIPPIS